MSGKREEKICKNCGSIFYPLSIKVREGKGFFCSVDCYKNYRKKHAQDPKELNKLYQKKHKYGLNKEEYKKLVEAHNNKCAICSREFDKTKRNSCNVDHSHKTGCVRGLLCHNCNVLLGLCDDNVEILENAIKYLTKWGNGATVSAGCLYHQG